MSDKYTEVVTPTMGLGEWGHVPYNEAVARLRAYCERQIDEAVLTLAAIGDGEVRVFHQYGPYAAKNRREVKPESGI